MENAKKSFKFGLIADIQYADCDDGSDFHKVEIRYFRNALKVVETARKHWLDCGIHFVMQLGDVIDGKNKSLASVEKKIDDDGRTKIMTASESALWDVKYAMRDLKRVDLVGNHEFYNFKREEMMGFLNITEESVRSELGSLLSSQEGEIGMLGQKIGDEKSSNANVVENKRFYYSFSPYSGWRFIVLDAYDISVFRPEKNEIGEEEDEEEEEVGMKWDEAWRILEAGNPNFAGFDRGKNKSISFDWVQGLEDAQRRYVPYNGAFGEHQLSWLNDELKNAEKRDQTVLIFSHIPLSKEAGTSSTVAWNAEKVMGILESYPKRVLGIFAGHNHTGKHCSSDGPNSVNQLTIAAPLLCAPGEIAFGTCELSNEEGSVCRIHGHGKVPSLEWRFAE